MKQELHFGEGDIIIILDGGGMLSWGGKVS